MVPQVPILPTHGRCTVSTSMSKAAKSGGDGSSSTSKEVDLYEFLKVSKSATNTEIRKAYYALARIVHPDKNPNDPNAEENFKALQKV